MYIYSKCNVFSFRGEHSVEVVIDEQSSYSDLIIMLCTRT